MRKTVSGERTKHLTEPASLADLYDPLTMPSALLKAHQKLDAAVDKDYEANGYCKAQATSKIGGLSRGLNPLAPPFFKVGNKSEDKSKEVTFAIVFPVWKREIEEDLIRICYIFNSHLKNKYDGYRHILEKNTPL